MGKQLLDEGLIWNHPILLALAGFYGLQVHWWIKILKILINGSDDSPKKVPASENKSD
jgi:hypothetical protein